MESVILIIAMILSFGSLASEETRKIVFTDNIQGLIEKGEELGYVTKKRTVHITKSIKVNLDYKVVRVNDNLTCYLPFPASKKDEVLAEIFAVKYNDYCEAVIDISAD